MPTNAINIKEINFLTLNAGGEGRGGKRKGIDSLFFNVIFLIVC
jgi:hypothetical protein